MRAFVAVTDKEWYRYLAGLPAVDEVNFWQPSAGQGFRALGAGEPLLFKLHYPDNAIVGGGFFLHYSRLPCSLAWAAFGKLNGAATFEGMRERIERYRRLDAPSVADYEIGCIILQDPFFFRERDWIPAPLGFARNIVRGKTYDLRVEPGRSLWGEVLEKRRAAGAREAQPPDISPPRRKPRLPSGAFRVLVTDAYARACAVTGERVLPVLQAAHIKPVHRGGPQAVENGLLLRSDVRILFGSGYLTVTPGQRLRVSRTIAQEFDDGEYYRRMEGAQVSVPRRAEDRPSRELLEWHGDVLFRG